MRARSTFLCWLRRRNIYYPVHEPEGEEWNRRGRGAGKSSRAANCPPSYPPYTLSHTLTVTTLIPLPPWSPPPAGSSLILHTVSPLFLPPQFLSSCSLSLGVPRRLESFRLPTPYKRSCCPFITTTLATTTRPRPPPPCLVPFSFLFLPPFLLPLPSSLFVPSSFAPPPTHFPFHLVGCSFISSFLTSCHSSRYT